MIALWIYIGVCYGICIKSIIEIPLDEFYWLDWVLFAIAPISVPLLLVLDLFDKR